MRALNPDAAGGSGLSHAIAPQIFREISGWRDGMIAAAERFCEGERIDVGA
jgi:hypothetical protein